MTPELIISEMYKDLEDSQYLFQAVDLIIIFFSHEFNSISFPHSIKLSITS